MKRPTTVPPTQPGTWAGVLGGLWLDYFGPRSSSLLGGLMNFAGTAHTTAHGTGDLEMDRTHCASHVVVMVVHRVLFVVPGGQGLLSDERRRHRHLCCDHGPGRQLGLQRRAQNQHPELPCRGSWQGATTPHTTHQHTRSWASLTLACAGGGCAGVLLRIELRCSHATLQR